MLGFFIEFINYLNPNELLSYFPLNRYLELPVTNHHVILRELIISLSRSSLPVLTSHGSRSHSQASAFDIDILNVSQFVQLVETFLGDSVIQVKFAVISSRLR